MQTKCTRMRKDNRKASNCNGLERGLLDSLPNDPHFCHIFGPPSRNVGGGYESRVTMLPELFFKKKFKKKLCQLIAQ